ncbi:MAG: 4Fe-4S dicluster domain-containing protein [Anaerolineales bacterium]|nr:4Fe-4S dicluster domain-containing protein [Anaerolineales bacterium]
MKPSSVNEKLAIDKFVLDEGFPHIQINQEICRLMCEKRYCLFVCPAKLYSEQNGEIIVEWAGCLECGTCQVACDHQALTWHYPRGGFGIHYRYG